MLEYTFEITHEGCWTETVNQTFPDVSASIIYSYQLFGTSITMVEVTNVPVGRVDALVSWLGEHEIMTAATLINYDEQREVAYVSLAGEYDGNVETEPVLNILLRNRCFPTVPPTVRNGVEHWTVLACDHETVSETHAELESMGNVTVNSLRSQDHDQLLTGLTEVKQAVRDLTPRQREVLAHAVAAGYYDSPRACGIEDLAALDSANTSTVGEHLRRSEAKILTAVGSLLESKQPATTVSQPRQPP